MKLGGAEGVGRGEEYYRVVEHSPVEREDVLPDPGEDKVSVWKKLGRARSLARWRKRKWGYPRLWIAGIWVAEGGPLRVEPSGPTDHYDLSGAPEDILDRARIVEDV